MSNRRRPAETAPQPQAAPRWYCLSSEGMATLCADEDDANDVAAQSHVAWPQHGPYRAVQMVVAAPDAAVEIADLRQQLDDERRQHDITRGQLELTRLARDEALRELDALHRSNYREAVGRA